MRTSTAQSASASCARSSSRGLATGDRRSSRTLISRAPTPRSIRTSAKTPLACESSSGSSRSPVGSRVMPRQRHQDRFTKAASWATRCRTHSARRSTIPNSSSPASSATGKQRRARWLRAGTRTSSSTRVSTVPCFRFCISTATRSRTRRCSRESRRRSSWTSSAVTAGSRCWSQEASAARNQLECTNVSPRR